MPNGFLHGPPLGSATKGGGVRWRVILPAALVVAAVPYVLAVQLINLYVTTDFFAARFFDTTIQDLTGSRGVEGFGELMGWYGMPLFYFLAAAGAALWVGRRVGEPASAHGILIGAISAAAVQAIGLLFGPPDLDELIVYPIAGVGGGLVGGLRGWTIRAGEEALHETNRAVGTVRSAQEAAAAIGKYLAGSEVTGVGLWTALGEARKFELLGAWTSRGARAMPAGVHLDPGRIPEVLTAPLVLRSGELPAHERFIWGKRGVRSVLFVPLNPPGGSFTGVLVVASRKRLGFSRRDVRACSTVGATAALVLENLRLVDRARQAGRRAGVLEERQRLAHEIHDTLAQGFTSIVTNLEAADGALSRDRSLLGWHLDQARIIARQSLAEARRLVWALRPEQLEDASLPEALQRLVERWSESSGVNAEAVVTGTPRPLPAEAEVTILRVAQEALTNVRKHACASRAALTLSYMGNRVVLDVRDDGVGFDPASLVRTSDGSGFGLRSMRERVEKAGGALSVESAPGEGVTLSAELPAAVPEPVRETR